MKNLKASFTVGILLLFLASIAVLSIILNNKSTNYDDRTRASEKKGSGLCAYREGQSFSASFHDSTVDGKESLTADYSLKNSALPPGLFNSEQNTMTFAFDAINVCTNENRRKCYTARPSIIVSDPYSSKCQITQSNPSINSRHYTGSSQPWEQTTNNFTQEMTVFGDKSSLVQQFKVEHLEQACLDGKTKILLADGRELEIRQIQKGELVLDPASGKAFPVEKVIAGPEPILPMYEIGYSQHVAIFSSDHPMITRDGIKAAKHISTDDYLLGSDHEYHRVTTLNIIPPNPEQMVYNLVIGSESHQMVANGIVTGDFVNQKKLIDAEVK